MSNLGIIGINDFLEIGLTDFFQELPIWVAEGNVGVTRAIALSGPLSSLSKRG
jgi:hypothetical protein